MDHIEFFSPRAGQTWSLRFTIAKKSDPECSLGLEKGLA